MKEERLLAREEVLRIYAARKAEIERRLAEFEELGKTLDDRGLFAELAFCLLTPQSKARSCWAAIEEMRGNGLLYEGSHEDIAPVLKRRGVRFHNTKALRVVEARDMFSRNGTLNVRDLLGMGSPPEVREWLVENIKGLGYKEASHFLRNVGLGENLAILDRHILRNLEYLGVIDDVPTSLSRKRYLDIEKRVIEFSRELEMPPSHLDLVLWSKEAGEVFK